MDVFVPALEDGTFSSGVFLLCRYSLRPFSVGLLAAGMRGLLLPFETGDCRDYATWLLADRGIKEEQTEVPRPAHTAIRALLENPAGVPPRPAQFERRGNILFSRSTP